MAGARYDLRDVKTLFTAADHVNGLLQGERRGRGVRARLEGVDPATGWGERVEGLIVAVAHLSLDHEFLVTFLVRTPTGLVTVGGRGALTEDVAAEVLLLV